MGDKWKFNPGSTIETVADPIGKEVASLPSFLGSLCNLLK
jgi:hypothetical protein